MTPNSSLDVASAEATSDSTFDCLFGAKAATSSAYHAVASPITGGTGRGDLSTQVARNRKVDPKTASSLAQKYAQDPQSTGIAASVGAPWADRESSAHAAGPFI